jgi:tripartite-type tricarboxylate transporter receptor subunit TctC
MRLPTRIAASALVFAAHASGPAQAAQPEADFPSRPMRLIVNFPPGGTTDILARLIGPKLAEAFKQAVVIDNRAGASGMIGANAVAKAGNDGYTFGFIISTNAISPALFANVPFDPVRDFAPITLLVSVPNVISVHPSVPASTLTELIALAKAQPGKLSFGTSGTGTAVHLTGELFKSLAKVDITHVPYKGGGPALSDLIAGQIPMGVQNIATVVQYVRAGRVRALGISSLERSPALPEVPTIASAGFPGFEAKEWYGLVAPAGTPVPIVARLNREIVRVMHLPDINARIAEQGAEIVADSPEQFGAFIKSELAKWTRIVRETGMRLE